ncbi:MAG: hypothetical protein QNJ70_15955 [Xenococcaceae cyanobacterium MO_207.B15]|nr:hypothetical protein [Xenococcaceae cyanobacterium MO_207.B15]
MNCKSFLAVSLLQATSLTIMLTISAEAQSVSGSNFNLNGLFTSNTAQKFFDEGVENLQKQVTILNIKPEADLTGDILKIKTKFEESEVPKATINPDDF